MLNYPSWKRLLVIGVCLFGLAGAFPNLFYSRVEQANDARALIERDGAETPELAADAALWPDFLPSGLVNLGLDLRGGAHVLVEVQLEDAQADRMGASGPSCATVCATCATRWARFAGSTVPPKNCGCGSGGPKEWRRR